jgi:hypothetical protein
MCSGLTTESTPIGAQIYSFGVAVHSAAMARPYETGVSGKAFATVPGPVPAPGQAGHNPSGSPQHPMFPVRGLFRVQWCSGAGVPGGR